ncbi:MAG TPA: DUF2306 domain-containing protein [Roseateles sp.]|uniref:DUF2306 domain-containing protein n=1 Tax=Roseateles sp. TaxID=1971397 RepID=UPI002ED9BF4B
MSARQPASAAAGLWFLVAATGLAIFASYIAVSYGVAALGGRPGQSKWVAGDGLGNAMLSLHLLLALLMTAGGVLQLIPALRRRLPAVHRGVGRVFMMGALLGSGSGLYLLWVRGTVGDLSQHLGMSLNALLIIGFALLAWRAARVRDFATHRRWALRLFLAANGVWFFRVGLMLWLMVFRRPVGFDPASFTGPFLTVLAFAQFLLPLAVLEIYLRSRGWAVAVLLGIASLATAGGVLGATMGMWLPRL